MDPAQVSQLISSVGFPIVACIFMWKAMEDAAKAHAEETKIMRDSLNENTVVLAELKTLMHEIAESLRGDP
jgi:hypothetical protein